MAYLSNHRRKIALSQVWLKKYGVWLIFFSKYLYGIKTIVPLAIGFSRFSIKTFFIFNAMSCAIWAVVVGICGYYASSGVISVLEEINAHSYVMPIVLLCIGIILYLIISFVSKRARKSL